MSMNLYHSNNIGNVAVLGHLGSGKTSVIEAMAKRAGISQQIGTLVKEQLFLTMTLKKLNVNLQLIYHLFP